MLSQCISGNKTNFGGDFVSGIVIKSTNTVITKENECRTFENNIKRMVSQNTAHEKSKNGIAIDQKLLLEPVVVLQKLRIRNYKQNIINCKALAKRSQKSNGKAVFPSIPLVKKGNRKRQPVVPLHRLDGIIPSSEQESKRQKKISGKQVFSLPQNIAIQPVVMLHNIFDKITSTTKKMLHCCNDRQLIVLVVDIFDNFNRFSQHGNSTFHCRKTNNFDHSKSLENQNSTFLLEQRGLQDFKLNQILTKPCTQEVINVELVTGLLVAAVSLGNAPSRHNRPFDLTNPQEECQAIVEALWTYAELVPPKEARHLFYSHRLIDHYKNGNLNVDVNILQHGEMRMASERKEKGWIYVSTIGSSDFLLKMTFIPEKQHQFEKKMLSIMKASLGVDPYNWTLSEVGYIIGFWLAKLYNAQGIPDENLPTELILAKEHFLELYSWDYDAALVIK